MAKGDVILFDQFKLDSRQGVHNLSADAFKFAVIKSAANGGIDPVAASPDPRWGIGGSTDLSASQVTVGGNYLDGGVALAGVTWTLAAGKTKFDSNDINIAMASTNPTNGRWGIVYNNTAAGKQAMCAVDFGADLDLTQDDLDYFVDAVKGWFENI